MSFFSRPDRFSFKDALAILFVSAFLFFCWRALNSRQALELVDALVSLVGIILGGYFVQEGASMYFNRHNRPENDERGKM